MPLCFPWEREIVLIFFFFLVAQIHTQPPTNEVLVHNLGGGGIMSLGPDELPESRQFNLYVTHKEIGQS